MSENRPIYSSSPGVPRTLEAFRNHPSAKPFAEGYEPPDGGTVAALIDVMGWSQNQVAMLVGANYNPKKGSPTVRRWKTDSDEHRQISYAAWRLLLVAAGVVDIRQDLDVIQPKVAGR